MLDKIKNLLKKYPWLLPAAGFIFIAFIAALSLGNTISTPTPVIVGVEPPTGSTISIYPVFKITFDRTPTQTQRTHFSSVLLPGVPLSSVWQDNMVALTPTNGLNPSAPYVLSLSYDQNLLISTTYTTLLLAQLQREDQARLQTEADYNFAQDQAKLLRDNPWLSQLPITTSQYTVVYDYGLLKIRIRLKVAFTDAQKRDLLQNLAQKGIPTGSVVWIEATPTPAP